MPAAPQAPTIPRRPATQPARPVISPAPAPAPAPRPKTPLKPGPGISPEPKDGDWTTRRNTNNACHSSF